MQKNQNQAIAAECQERVDKCGKDRWVMKLIIADPQLLLIAGKK